MTRRRLGAGVLVATLLAMAAAASATTSRALSVEDLVGRADRVLVGRVRSVSRVATVREGRLVARTVADVQVEQALRGGDGTVRVVTREGAMLGWRVFQDGMPHLRRGQRTLLFLRRTPEGFEAVGGAQGAFVITEGTDARLVRAGDVSFAFDADRAKALEGRPRLEDVLATVRSEVSR